MSISRRNFLVAVTSAFFYDSSATPLPKVVSSNPSAEKIFSGPFDESVASVVQAVKDTFGQSVTDNFLSLHSEAYPSVRAALDSVLSTAVNEGVISEAEIVCDDSLNPPSAQDAGEFYVRVAFRTAQNGPITQLNMMAYPEVLSTD